MSAFIVKVLIHVKDLERLFKENPKLKTKEGRIYFETLKGGLKK